MWREYAQLQLVTTIHKLTKTQYRMSNKVLVVMGLMTKQYCCVQLTAYYTITLSTNNRTSVSGTTCSFNFRPIVRRSGARESTLVARLTNTSIAPSECGIANSALTGPIWREVAKESGVFASRMRLLGCWNCPRVRALVCLHEHCLHSQAHNTLITTLQANCRLLPNTFGG